MCVRRDLCPLAISRQRFYSFLFKKVFIFLCHLNLPNDQHYCTAKCLLVPPCRCPVSSVARTGNDRAKSPLQTDHQPTKKQYKFYVLCLVWRCCNFSNFSSLMQSSGRRANLQRALFFARSSGFYQLTTFDAQQGVVRIFLTREKCLWRLAELTATFV